MTTTIQRNHATEQAADQSMIDGFTKHAATLVSLLIGGADVKTADLVATLQARIAAIARALAAYSAYLDAVAAMRKELADTAELVSGARAALKVAFAGQAQALGDFGLAPRKKPAPLTAEQQAAAVAKAKATRAARHTMGPKQKAQVTGASAAAAAPVVPAPAAPAALPANAPPAAPAAGGTSKS